MINAEQAAQYLGWATFPAGWGLIEIMREGQLSGFVLVKGHEVHAFRLPEYIGRWGTRKDMQRVLQPLINQYGLVTTKVMQANKNGHRFVQRIGFKPTGQDSTAVHYTLKRLLHANDA